MEKDGCEPKAEEKTQCRSRQVEYIKNALDQTSGIDLSRGSCDHSPRSEICDGTWPREKLAKYTYSYLLALAS